MKDKRELEFLLPMGFVFLGGGIVFWFTINNAVGLALIALGIAYIVMSVIKKRKK